MTEFTDTDMSFHLVSGITSARPPRDGYVLQTSNSVTGSSDTEVNSSTILVLSPWRTLVK